MTPTNPININISDTNEKNESYNEFKDYIIKNNIELQGELKKSNIRIKKLESQLQEEEENVDKRDTRLRYVKGLLQNLNEIRKDYSTISLKTEEKLTLVKEHSKKTKIIYFEMLKILVFVNLLTFITPFSFDNINMFNVILQAIYFTLVPFCIFKVKNKYYLLVEDTKNTINNLKEITSSITIIKTEVKKTEESCFSIENWINET